MEKLSQEARFKADSLIDKIRLYPSTQWVTGKISTEDECLKVAENVWKELIVDRRIRPEDVPLLLELHQVVYFGAEEE